MAFAIEDFRDLLRLLEDHPEWKAELRRSILDEEFMRLPELVRQNSVDIAQNSADIRELKEVVAQNSADIRELKEVVAQHTAELAELRERIEELTAAVEQLVAVTQLHTDQVGALRGDILELRYWRNPARLIPHARLRRPRPVDLAELTLLDDAEEQGIVTPAEAEAVSKVDLVVQGREGRGDAAAEALVVVEISRTIRQADIERALQRAAILRKAGYNAYPAVAGQLVRDEDRERAEASGVEVYIETE